MIIIGRDEVHSEISESLLEFYISLQDRSDAAYVIDRDRDITEFRMRSAV